MIQGKTKRRRVEVKEFALRAQKEIKLVVYFKLIIQNVNQSKTKKKTKIKESQKK